MKQRRTMAEATTMMENRLTSGLSVQAFCVAENINPATYYYWRKRQKLNENPESSRLIPVCIEKPKHHSGTNRENLELTYPNGVRLSVPSGCELNLIRELVLIM
ncbi:MAG: hypothetical protein WCL21_16400 [Mariniphaga sp.]